MSFFSTPRNSHNHTTYPATPMTRVPGAFPQTPRFFNFTTETTSYNPVHIVTSILSLAFVSIYGLISNITTALQYDPPTFATPARMNATFRRAIFKRELEAKKESPVTAIAETIHADLRTIGVIDSALFVMPRKKEHPLVFHKTIYSPKSPGSSNKIYVKTPEKDDKSEAEVCNTPTKIQDVTKKAENCKALVIVDPELAELQCTLQKLVTKLCPHPSASKTVHPSAKSGTVVINIPDADMKINLEISPLSSNTITASTPSNARKIKSPSGKWVITHNASTPLSVTYDPDMMDLDTPLLYPSNPLQEHYHKRLAFLSALDLTPDSLCTQYLRFQLPIHALSLANSLPDRSLFTHLCTLLSDMTFLASYDILIPAIGTGPTPTNWATRHVAAWKINKMSNFQQADGCCYVCRGQEWAGALWVRQMDEDGNIPADEERAYSNNDKKLLAAGDHTPRHAKWCRESRWDWRFETPPLDGLREDGEEWCIRAVDPRIRHAAIESVEPDEDTLTRNVRAKQALNLMKRYSHEDLVVERFLHQVGKWGGEHVLRAYTEMNIERKRRLVQTKHMCVRQVEVIPFQDLELEFDAWSLKRKAQEEKYGYDFGPIKKQKVDVGLINHGYIDERLLAPLVEARKQVMGGMRFNDEVAMGEPETKWEKYEREWNEMQQELNHPKKTVHWLNEVVEIPEGRDKGRSRVLKW